MIDREYFHEKRDYKVMQQKSNSRLPRIAEPIFVFKKIKLEDLEQSHSRHHKELDCILNANI